MHIKMNTHWRFYSIQAGTGRCCHLCEGKAADADISVKQDELYGRTEGRQRGWLVHLSLTEKGQGSKPDGPLPDQTKPACPSATYPRPHFRIAATETEHKTQGGKLCHRYCPLFHGGAKNELGRGGEQTIGRTQPLWVQAGSLPPAPA